MPVSHALWTGGESPTEVPCSKLASERPLEDIMVAESRWLKHP